MATPVIASYGSWRSPISSDLLAAESVYLSEPRFDGDAIYWLESRPCEEGRVAVVRIGAEGQPLDVISQPFSARTCVHEYGGGAYAVAGGVVYFSNFTDQQLYRIRPGEAPAPITSEPGLRYADTVVDRNRNRLICVREDHRQENGEARNEIVSVALDGSGSSVVLVSGNDFYSSPRLDPGGTQAAWLTWSHPNMPWTSAELWVADVDAKGELIRLHQVAGGLGESIFQPEWSPDAVLYFVSDRTGWWNLYRWRDGTIEHVLPMEAEFGQPQWCFGMSTYAFESQRSLVFAYAVRGSWKLGQLETSNLHWRPIDLPYKEISDVQARPGSAVFCAGSPTEPLAVALLDLKSNAIKLIRSASPTRPELARYISVPKEIEFPTENGKTAHAFYYPPHNPEFSAPAEELPPLLVKIHGGPTAAASSTLDLRVQYWTSRGFAVIDVNYGGSTGYGREYRFRLEHGWGVVDLDDCVNAAKFLIQRGLVEPSKLAISGGSAGGYTTLCALTFRETFHAGASYYGICDLEALARVTHKFESRYLEWLIGPYPQQVELYRQRSPINFVERLAVPTVFFQGEEDPIVRPNQAELMVDALRARGVPFGYLLFSGEQHGFRRATSIKQALDAELYFYSVQLLRRGLRF